MFNLKTKKKAESDESYKYVANALSDMALQQNKKIFAVTSSCSKGSYRLITEHIFKKLINAGTKSLLIDARFDDSKKEFVGSIAETGNESKMNLVNVNKKTFKKILCDNENTYDIILVVIPPVILKSEALEYAKVCNNAILIEKYMCSRYEDYENSLLYLKSANINVEGVIACK